MKLINFRCINCGHDEDLFDDEIEIIEGQEILCPKCNSEMKEFNFKNNNQRWCYCDPQK